MSRSSAALLVVLCMALGCKDKPTTGDLVVTINGLPGGAPAVVRVTGPGGYDQHVTATTTLQGLAPGDYTIIVNSVHFSGAVYSAPTLQELRTISAGHSESLTIPYTLASGSINLVVNGLPPGMLPNVVLICSACGTGGSVKQVQASGIVPELVPGTYVLRADTLLSVDGDRFGADNFQQTVSVAASLTPVDATVNYAIASGTLSVTVDGLPSSVTPSPVTITGPAYTKSIAASTVMRGLTAGTYTINAVTSNGACPDVYTPQQTSQTAQVTIGSTASASVSFDHSQISPSTLNLRVDGLHLIQVVQDYTGITPMVANKPALLRVFAVANQCNLQTTPVVRVTLAGIPNARTIDIPATESSVRTAPEQGVLAATYNVQLNPADVVPGLTVVAQIDPTNAVAETDETDNRFPATNAKAIDVRVVPSASIRFIPVTSNGLTGNVSDARINEILTFSRQIHPTFSYDAEVGEGFTSSVALNSGGQTWGQVLTELNAKRVADSAANGTRRYYVGVVKVNYNSGVAGIGFLPGKTTLAWDYPNSTGPIVAHELGHNYGRAHTPCGGPGGIDQNYPNTGNYLGGYIGQYGIDLATMNLKQPQFFTDVMGYCNNQWISDYTYFYMMQYLIDHPVSQPMVTSAPSEPALLVWGRVVDGAPVLEPAFEINTHVELPRTGALRLTALDENGAEIFGMPFAGERIADMQGDNQSFAFAIPMSMLRGRSLGSLRLTANGRTVTNRPAGEVAADTRTVVTRTGPRAMRVQWDAGRFPVVMVRDRRTGEVLSFARNGDASIATSSDAVELVYSNRVRSTRVVRQLR